MDSVNNSICTQTNFILKWKIGLATQASCGGSLLGKLHFVVRSCLPNVPKQVTLLRSSVNSVVAQKKLQCSVALHNHKDRHLTYKMFLSWLFLCLCFCFFFSTRKTFSEWCEDNKSKKNPYWDACRHHHIMLQIRYYQPCDAHFDQFRL